MRDLFINRRIVIFLFCRNTLRITKASQLESVDPKAKKNVGAEDFDFDSLKVEFVECNAFSKDGSANIEELKQWLVKIA